MSDPLLEQRVKTLEEQMRRHKHNGAESSNFSQFRGYYYSMEVDLGSVATTATIDWTKGNVQYVTLTADTTFTFIGGSGGLRHMLHVAGAFTPTFSSVRWPGGITPVATASAGHKDIYTFVYSAKESLYDGTQVANFATS